MARNILHFCKNEIVLCISALLALVSIIFVPVDRSYLSYIDLRTLALLLCLMLVTSGFQAQGLFSRLGHALLSRAHSAKALALVLVLLCYFTSMLVTNDVALITFVPFAILVLQMCGLSSQIIPVVVLQTIAANLGSMLTPIGNPQNLYLYAAANMSALELIRLMLPYSALALAGVCLGSMLIRGGHIDTPDVEEDEPPISVTIVAVYTALFILCLLTVLHVLDFQVTLLISALAVLICDRKRFAKVDYSLLFTFTALFIFIGNLGRIAPVHNFLTAAVSGRETLVGVIASQVFSNVPAAILLNGFTGNTRALIEGVNIGGLGTLIASMASLISFRAYTTRMGNAGRFLAVFTVMNLIFLVLELGLWYFIR